MNSRTMNEIIYHSLTTQEIALIPRIAGIYCLLNTRSGRRYVGESTNLHKRLEVHRRQIARGHSDNRGLRHDVATAGFRYTDFVFAILGFAENVSGRLAAQNWYIDLFCASDSRFGYNDTQGDGRSLEARQRDQEQKFARRRKFEFLDDADLTGPMNPLYLYSCAKARGILALCHQCLVPRLSV